MISIILQIQTRVEECFQALEVMEKLKAGEQIEFAHFVPSRDFLTGLKSRLDTANSIVAGHSFGGATAVKALLEKVF